MAHRTYRLSITPERAPNVRRVVDFDGRSSLYDVHAMIQSTLELDDDHLYAFYLSGKYFDTQTEYAETSRRSAHTALLFRLGLREGKSFAYLFDFGDELRHTVTVVSISDVPAPLEQPILVESVGEAPPQYPNSDEFDEESDADEEQAESLPPELVQLASLARKFIELDEMVELQSPEQPVAALLLDLAKVALELGQALQADIQRFAALEAWFGMDDLASGLLELPTRLSLAGEVESALEVARTFTFLSPDQLRGELALIHARAGRRAEAEAQIAINLASVENASIAEGMAGDVYRAFGDSASAEAYYQRALVEAKEPDDRELAATRLASFFLDAGREREAQALLKELIPPPKAPAASSKAVGRNEPCPCGSGKKYKKCHGAPAG